MALFFLTLSAILRLRFSMVVAIMSDTDALANDIAIPPMSRLIDHHLQMWEVSSEYVGFLRIGRRLGLS